MATVRQVPSAYPTIQAAHDAAVEGDTIVVAPGSYAGVNLSKRVHLKGETTDSATVIVQATATVPAIFIALPGAGTVGDLWIEGVTLKRASDSYVPLFKATVTPALRVRINRCRFDHAGGIAYPLSVNYATTSPWWLALSSCHILGWAQDVAMALVAANASNVLTMTECLLAGAPTFWAVPPGGRLALPPAWATYQVDYRTAATPGYGPAYGTWYAEQWMGRQYALGGIVRPRGVDAASQWQCLIYRERLGGGMEATAWAQATPDPITGLVRVGYLPTDRRYYVAMIGPQGYPPSLHGPYDPAQEP